MDDYQARTPGKTTSPPVNQENDQGQGSCVKNSTTMFQPKVKLDEWGPDSSSRAPGDKE